MGAFGTGLYDDDHAMDIKSLYKDLRRAHVVGTRATDLLLENCFEGDSGTFEGDPIFWLVLLDLQWKDGVVDERVRENARNVLSAGAGLELWEDPKDRKDREKVYSKLLSLLSKPPPAPKEVGEPFFDSCPWQIGEIVAYRLGTKNKENGGQIVLLHVVNHYTKLGGSSPMFELMSWLGKELPTAMPSNLMPLNTLGCEIDLRSKPMQEQMKSWLGPAQKDGRIASDVTIEDVIRAKTTTRIPVVSFTGKDAQRRSVERLGFTLMPPPPHKLLQWMVPYTWKDFDSFAARLYRENWNPNSGSS